MPAGSDIREAAMASARSIRGELADALHHESAALFRSARGPEIAHRATVAIGALYAVEIGDPQRVELGLAEAVGILGHLLEDLGRDRNAAPAELVATIARALARLEPAHRALADALGRA